MSVREQQDQVDANASNGPELAKVNTSISNNVAEAKKLFESLKALLDPIRDHKSSDVEVINCYVESAQDQLMAYKICNMKAVLTSMPQCSAHHHKMWLSNLQIANDQTSFLTLAWDSSRDLNITKEQLWFRKGAVQQQIYDLKGDIYA